MNTAQKVRVWLIVGFSAIMGICIAGAASSVTNPMYTDPSSGMGIYDVHAAETWIGWAVIMFVTNAVLAGFTIFRMYKPLPADHKPMASGQVTWKGTTYYSDGRREPSNPAGYQPAQDTDKIQFASPPEPRPAGDDWAEYHRDTGK